jgi:Fe-S cluster assembly iron-binding protein IscA
MTAQKGNKAKYVLALLAALAAVLWMNVNTAHAAQKLALFNFETASDMKLEKGAKVDLAGDQKASSWTSSNAKVVKISKSGIATAVRPGKAVISAKIDGQKKECQITVVKDVVKSSSYLKNVYRTWKEPDSGKKVTVKSGGFQKGLDSFLKNIKKENEDDVAYKKCSKITAVEEDSAGATVYFQAVGVLNGKEMTFPCVAVFTNDYEHDNYDYALMFQPVIWKTDDGQLLYGAGIFWYA